MGRPFADPQGRRLLREIRAVFETKGIFHRRDRPTVFVCGGPVADGAGTMRACFLEWAKVNLSNFVFILAEVAFREVLFAEGPRFINLSKFEKLIADISDCVLVFPESVGSYAEVGFFSGVSAICRKTLIANEYVHQGKDSFLITGPIDTISLRSDFRPALYLQIDQGQIDFEKIARLLSRLTTASRRDQFRYANYGDLRFRERYLATLATIVLLGVATRQGLHESLRASFERVSPWEVNRLLAVLAAAGYIRREGEYLVPLEAGISVLEFEGVNRAEIVARSKYYYKHYNPEAYDVSRRVYE